MISPLYFSKLDRNLDEENFSQYGTKRLDILLTCSVDGTRTLLKGGLNLLLQPIAKFEK